MTAEELKKKRKASGMGQRGLAKASGIPQKVISAAENGRTRLSRGAVRRLQTALTRG